MPGGRPKGALGRRHALRRQMTEVLDGRKLLKALQDHVLGLQELTMSQVKAAGIALSKICPTLHSVDAQQDVKVQYVISAPALTAEQWEGQAQDYLQLGAPTGPTETPH